MPPPGQVPEQYGTTWYVSERWVDEHAQQLSSIGRCREARRVLQDEVRQGVRACIL